MYIYLRVIGLLSRVVQHQGKRITGQVYINLFGCSMIATKEEDPLENHVPLIVASEKLICNVRQRSWEMCGKSFCAAADSNSCLFVKLSLLCKPWPLLHLGIIISVYQTTLGCPPFPCLPGHIRLSANPTSSINICTRRMKILTR